MLVCFPHLYQQDGRDSSSLDCKLGNGLTFAVRICFTGGGVTHFLPNSHDRTCSPWFLILDADGFFTLCGAFRMRVGDVESSVSPATLGSVADQHQNWGKFGCLKVDMVENRKNPNRKQVLCDL